MAAHRKDHIMLQVGQRFAAGTKFGPAFTVVGFHPVKPLARIVQEGMEGERFVAVRALQHSVFCGTVREIGTGFAGQNKIAAAENSGCKPAGSVVSCFYGGQRLGGPQTTANNGQSAGENVMENTVNGAQIVPFVKMQNASGKYAIFQVPGHSRRIYIDTALFPGKVTPESITVTGLVPATADVDAATREQEKAAKAQEKAEKMRTAAEARVAKATAAAEKAKAQAEAALARAEKARLAAGGAPAPATTAAPVNVEQPNL
jgi:hypothetical protein